MSTKEPVNDPVPEGNHVGDENVERLISQAYRPEEPDAEFVRRATEAMHAAATQAGKPSRPAPGPSHRRYARWAFWAAAAGVLVCAGAILGSVLFGGPELRRDGETVWINGQQYVPPPTAEGTQEALTSPPSNRPTQAAGQELGRSTHQDHLYAYPPALDPLSPKDTVKACLTALPSPQALDGAAVAVGQSWQTGPTERRRVGLPDGSVLYINGNSDVQLAADRQVTVKAGEIFVDVAPRYGDEDGDETPQAERFVVDTPDRELVALGTKFDVRVDDAGTGVVVTQGRVEVSGVDTPLEAGQQLSLDPVAGQGIEPAVGPSPRASHVVDWARDLMAAARSPLVPASKYAGGALVAKDPGGNDSRLAMRRYHVDVHIEDGFARTTIDQTYFNHLPWRLEGTFYFPLPPDASLSRLAMYVGDTLMEGGMAEREHARQTFESIVRRQKDPALLEWIDGSTFKMRVFPLEGRQEKRIIISYTQKLPSLYDRTEYRFPGGHNMDEVDHWSTTIRVVGGAGQRWASDSHKFKAVKQGGDLVLEASAEKIKPDRDIRLTLYDKTPAPSGKPSARFATAEQEGWKYLMLRWRPELSGQEKHPRRDWIFLVETSADRDPVLARAQIEIVRSILANAERDDTFAILTAGTRTEAFAPKARKATPKNIEKAVAFLEKAHLVGALDLDQALEDVEPFAAAENPVLVHVGAGIAVIGERDIDALVRRIPEGVEYVGVGVGKRWARNFMKTAAARTGGYFTQINPDEQVAWRAFDLLSVLNTPRLLKLKVADDAGRLAFLYHNDSLAQGEELCAVTRIKADAELPKWVDVAGTLEGRPFAEKIRVRDVSPQAGYLPRTWAKLRIDQLVAAGAMENHDEIVRLSKAMYVMSPFTSLLVLENEAMYAEYKVDRGRKDHWALYPCPEKIEVVHEPLPKQPKIAAAAPQPQEGPTVGDVLQTVLVRTPPQILRLPHGWTHAGSPTFNTWQAIAGVYGYMPYVYVPATADGSTADFDDLVRLIEQTVRPEIWSDVGGPGELGDMNTNLSLVIRQGQGIVADTTSSALFWDIDDDGIVGRTYFINGYAQPWMMSDGVSNTTMLGERFGLWSRGHPGEGYFEYTEGPLWTGSGVPLVQNDGSVHFVNGPGYYFPPDANGRIVALPSLHRPTLIAYWLARNENGNGTWGWRNEANYRLPLLPTEALAFHDRRLEDLPDFVDGYNRLMDEGRFEEAELLARRASERDPDDPVTAQMLSQSKWVRHYHSSLARSQAAGRGFFDPLASVDQSGVPFDDWGAYTFADPMAWRVARQKGVVDSLYQIELSHVPPPDGPPITYPDPKGWEELTRRRMRFAGRFDGGFEYGFGGLGGFGGGSYGASSGTLGATGRPIVVYGDVPVDGEVVASRDFNQSILLDLYGYDQPFAPQGSLFIELYNPWQSVRVASPAERLAYRRPEFNRDGSALYDLVGYAPGMNTSWADVLAVLEDEVGPGEVLKPGHVDPHARALIDRARRAGWQRVTWTDGKGKPQFSLAVDGAGRYRYERATIHGLDEQVTCDGRQLLDLYPELGLAARRTVSRFHRAYLARLVPWLLPPAEDLAHGSDLVALDNRTVAIVPHAIEPPKDKDAASEGDEAEPQKTLRVHLVFADDGNLAERRLVLMPEGKTLLRQTYTPDGTIKLLGEKDKVLAERELTVEACDRPELEPDTSKLVVLPLPLRSRAHVCTTRKLQEDRRYERWEADDALAMIAATLGTHPVECRRIIGQRFFQRGDRRIGFYTLLASMGMTWNVDEPQEMAGGVKVKMDPLADHPEEPLARYIGGWLNARFAEQVAKAKAEKTGDKEGASKEALEKIGPVGGPGDGFIAELAEYHDLRAEIGRRASQSDKPVKMTADQGRPLLRFARRCHSPALAWAALEMALDTTGGGDYYREVARAAGRFDDVPGLAYVGRYERARALVKGGQPAVARELFAELMGEVIDAGGVPRIDADVYRAFANREAGKKRWGELWRDAAGKFIDRHARTAVIALAWQIHHNGDPPLADELLTLATADVPESARLPVTLAAVEYLWNTDQKARADAALAPLLADKRYAKSPWLWCLAAAIAEKRDMLARSIEYLDRAVELVHEKLPDDVNIEVVRRDFRLLLDRCQRLAAAVSSMEGEPPRDLMARVVRWADRWRAVDPDPKEACDRAGRILCDLGAGELAWEYYTTPLAGRPDEAQPWKELAEALRQQAHFDLADRAYASAFERERTNADLLFSRAQVLLQSGRQEEAEKLYRQITEGDWPGDKEAVRAKAQRLMEAY